MPNFGFYDDEEKITCEYCGTKYWPDEFHTCDEGLEASRKRTENWERKYKGKGRIRGRMVVDFVCYDSEDAIQTVMRDVNYEMFYGLVRTNHNSDEILEYAWQAQLQKAKI